MKLSDLQTDVKKETEGVWFEAGKGLRLLIARMNNPNHEAEARKLGKPYFHQLRAGTMDMKVIEDLQKQSIAKTVLLGWENLEDDANQQIPYSPETALKLIREVPDFYRLVVEFSNDAASYRATIQADAAKN